MSEELQRPTVEISKSVWKKFIMKVGRRRGIERGALREELEKALKKY
jgi:hypothetical protein